MEKGFNDQELADIMNEIENLEREITSEEVPTPKQEALQAAPVLRELAERPMQSAAAASQNKSVHPAADAAASRLSFKVEGQMKVSLAFDVAGQSVYLDIGEEALTIQTESGAKFSLPLAKVESSKKAA